MPEQTPLARGTVLGSCKDQNENCSFSGLLSVLGTVLLGLLLEEHRGIYRAKNILSSSKNKSGRSSESLQLVGFWWWAAGGMVLFMLVPIICYSLCCSLAAESVHKAPAAQDGPAGPSGMMCPQEMGGFYLWPMCFSEEPPRLYFRIIFFPSLILRFHICDIYLCHGVS